MIEILTVIVIILILIGIIFTGTRYIVSASRARSTRATLANLQSLLSAYDASSRTALQQITDAYTAYQGAYSVNVNPIVFPAITVTDTGVTQPQNPNDPAAIPADMHRYDPFVQITSTIAMARILSLPENKTAMAKISTKMLPTWLTVAGAPATNILLDAWGNPIIYVPASGLVNVQLKSDSTKYYRVQSTGVQSYTTFNSPPVANANARPFFASAGPDGDFAKGDDNIYSFEQ